MKLKQEGLIPKNTTAKGVVCAKFQLRRQFGGEGDQD
jgi:hypothetical protein